MNRFYTVARSVPFTMIVLDEHGNATQTQERMLSLTIQSTNPEYSLPRDCDRINWSKIYRHMRKHDYDPERGADASTIGQRANMQARIAACERRGFVGVYWSGTDCDGAHWSRSYAMPAHMLRALEHEIEVDTGWLDGPAFVTLDTPRDRDVDYYCTIEGVTIPPR